MDTETWRIDVTRRYSEKSWPNDAPRAYTALRLHSPDGNTDFHIIKYAGDGSDELAIDASAFHWKRNGWNSIPADVFYAFMLVVQNEDPNKNADLDEYERYTEYLMDAQHVKSVAVDARSYNVGPRIS